MKALRITVLKVCGSTRKSNQGNPILRFSDDETVMLDFDDTIFRIVKYWAFRTVRFHKLEGFIILKSSEDSYHVVFNSPVSWSENMRTVAWVSYCSVVMKTYFIMQCIKESSTLRASNKGDKPSPRIVYRYGKQDKQVKEFLLFRREIKRIIRKMQKKKPENKEAT